MKSNKTKQAKIKNKNNKEQFAEKQAKVNHKKQIVEICDRVFDNKKYGGLLKRPFAHRGVHLNYPENSVPAFEEAVRQNLAIELDVHLTKDNKLVVFHDDNLLRMTGKDDFVKFLDLKELEEIKLNGSEETIPSFKKVLSLVAGKVPVLVEVKTELNTKKICKCLVEELKDYQGQVFVQSFNPFVLRYFFKNCPQYLRGQLSSFFKGSKFGFFKRILVKGLRLNKFAHIDFVAYNIDNLPNKYVKKSNLPILAWTIKTEEQLNKAKISANNVIVDNVELLNKE